MICVDASVVAKWLFVEEYSDQALALATTYISAGQRIVAPPLLPFEVANTIRRHMVRDQLSLPGAYEALTRFESYPIEYQHAPEIHHTALAVAETYGLPAAYDAHYIALAQLLDCSLWTDDRRLLRAVAGRLPFIRWIGDYTDGQPL